MSMTVIEWYKSGWRVFAANPLRLIAGFLIFAVLTGVLEVLNEALRIEGWFVHVVQIIIAPVAFAGWALFCLRTIRGERPAPVRVFDGFYLFRPAFIAGAIVAISFVIGLALFVVPALLVAAIWGMWPFGVMDRRFGALDALNYSVRITRGRRMELLIAALIYLVLTFLGALVFGVGLLVVGPWVGATYAVIYEDLIGGQIEKTGEVEYEVIE